MIYEGLLKVEKLVKRGYSEKFGKSIHLCRTSPVRSFLLATTGSNAGVVSPQTTSLKSRGVGLLRKLKMSAELLIAVVALLSWLAVGVVMFDFVEYKTVPGR